MDSINQWKRQDETPYLIDPETAAATTRPASPSSPDAHQISSDPEPDADDWDYDRTAGPPPPRSLELDGVDWDEINDEVEAAMNESEDDGDGDGDESGSVRSGEKSANVSEDEWTDESNSVIG
jgi:RNA polymerase II subunit A C-terminal domain phosphatase